MMAMVITSFLPEEEEGASQNRMGCGDGHPLTLHRRGMGMVMATGSPFTEEEMYCGRGDHVPLPRQAPLFTRASSLA